jgi:hypothetical protein
MKTWLRQLFCGHIWRPVEAELLGGGDVVIWEIKVREYKRYAVKSICVKCSKTQITEEKYYNDLP